MAPKPSLLGRGQFPGDIGFCTRTLASDASCNLHGPPARFPICFCVLSKSLIMGRSVVPVIDSECTGGACIPRSTLASWAFRSCNVRSSSSLDNKPALRIFWMLVGIREAPRLPQGPRARTTPKEGAYLRLEPGRGGGHTTTNDATTLQSSQT